MLDHKGHKEVRLFGAEPELGVFQYTTFYLRDHNTDGHLLLFFFEAVHLGHKRVRLFGTGPELGVFQETTSYLREHITDGHLLLVLSKFVLLVTTE